MSVDQIGAFDLNLLGGWPKTSRNSREKCEAVSNPTAISIIGALVCVTRRLARSRRTLLYACAGEAFVFSMKRRSSCLRDSPTEDANFGIEIVFSMRLSKTMSAALNRDYSRLSKKSVAV